MKYRIAKIHTNVKDPRADILIIYLGGTIGMVEDRDHSLIAINFNHIMQQLPALDTLEVSITVISFPVSLDSSNMVVQNWLDIATIIQENYKNYDGFIILQGTDTMAYSASALSFLLEGLNKPVIFTGAQLPISAVHSDARPNLISAIEIAALKKSGNAVVPEVCVYFDYKLLRGNRTTKIRSSQFNAFESLNYPPLAEVGISIDFNESMILRRDNRHKLVVRSKMDPNVAVLRIFPSFSIEILDGILNIEGLKGVVLETYGSGNAPTYDWFIDRLQKAIRKGIIIYNVSQCVGGKVIQGRYATSRILEEIGVVSGWNITIEAAITKMMYLLGQQKSPEKIKSMLEMPLCGEMDVG